MVIDLNNVISMDLRLKHLQWRKYYNYHKMWFFD